MTELTFCPTCTDLAMPITAVVHACPQCKTTITEDIYAQRQQAIQNLAAGLDMPPGLLEEFPEGHGHYAHHMRPGGSCAANIADHGAPFAPAPCITKGDHSTHTGANGETWTDPPIGPDYDGDWPDPEPDDLTREQLAEIDPMWRAVADTLDEWLSRMHGIATSHHNAGAFLDWLAANGYRVTAIPKPLGDFATLVPGYLD